MNSDFKYDYDQIYPELETSTEDNQKDESLSTSQTETNPNDEEDRSKSELQSGFEFGVARDSRSWDEKRSSRTSSTSQTETNPNDEEDRSKSELQSGFEFGVARDSRSWDEKRSSRTSSTSQTETNPNDEEDRSKSELKKVKARALKLLARREYSTHKITQKLLEIGYQTDHIEEVLEWAREKDFLNDERYLRARTRALVLKKYSSTQIKIKLRAENIQADEEVIQEILEAEKLSEDDLVQYHMEKKLRSLARVPAHKRREKLISSLLTKGFSHGAILRNIREAQVE